MDDKNMYHKKFYVCDFSLFSVQILFKDHVTFLKYCQSPLCGSYRHWTKYGYPFRYGQWKFK